MFFIKKNSLILKLSFFMVKISINDNFLSLLVEYDNLSLLSNQKLKNKIKKTFILKLNYINIEGLNKYNM